MKNWLISLMILVAFAAAAPAQTSVRLGGPDAGKSGAVVRRAADSAEAPVSGPTLGVVVDRSAAGIRRLAGFPGWASMEEPFALETSFADAWTAPQQDYLLGVAAENGGLTVLLTGRGLVTGSRALASVPPSPDRVEFSPSGRAVALYYREAAKLIAISGMPLDPAVSGEWDLASWGAGLTALAVADSGRLALAGVPGSVVALEPNAAPRTALAAVDPSALRFTWNGTDAVVADRGRNEVLWLRDPSGAAAAELLLGEAQGLARPAELALSQDGRLLTVRMENSSAVMVYDTGAATLRQFECGREPSMLRPLNGTYAYQLTAGPGPLLALDADPEAARIFAIDDGSAGGGARRKAAGPPGRGGRPTTPRGGAR